MPLCLLLPLAWPWAGACVGAEGGWEGGVVFFSDLVGRCSPLASGLPTVEAVLPASVMLPSPLLLEGDVCVCLGLHTCFQDP